MSRESSPLLNYGLFGVSGGSATAPGGASRSLGTFFGVMVPTVLSMFNIVVFLRIGFVVGQAGLLQALLMLGVAYFIIFLTILSVCAISTNGAVQGGGAYFMISRTLGPEFGGSIGLMFYLANVCACGVYMLGLVEAILDVFGKVPGSSEHDALRVLPQGYWYSLMYSSALLLLCLLVCLVGAKVYSRASFFILLIVTLSLLSIFISPLALSPRSFFIVHQDGANITYNASYTGFNATTLRSNLYGNYSRDYTTAKMMTFATVFAVMFTGCKGIMAGANMSGELKNPSLSIPKGTIIAVSYTLVIYLLLFFLVSSTCDRVLLLQDYGFFQRINVWPPFVIIGVYCASLSASMGTLIGASRILHALAKDELFGRPLAPAKVTSSSGNPWVAVLYTWALVQVVLCAGQLNALASLVTVFYLLAYAAVDLACLALEWASAPNFRPTFQLFSWHTCLLGLLSCVVMMFLINAVYSSASMVLLLLLLLLLHYRAPTSSWGYISQALIFHQVRKYLLMLDVRKEHVKFWRPQVLLMVANPRSSCQLISFINDLKKGGLFILGHVQLGDLGENTDQCTWGHWSTLVCRCLKISSCNSILLYCSTQSHYCITLLLCPVCIKCLQAHFPPVRDAESSRSLAPDEYVSIIADAIKMQKNVCLARYFFQLEVERERGLGGWRRGREREKGSIDVWPLNLLRPESSGFVDVCSLFLLQMACILNMATGWRRARLRIFLCVESESGDQGWMAKEEKLRELLGKLRIRATIRIVDWDTVARLHWGKKPRAATPGAGGGGQGADFDGSSLATAPSAACATLPGPVSDDFLSALNRLLRENSGDAVVRFLYLPCPPADTSQLQSYLSQLEVMTRDLGPTLLIHGLTPVTCTDL
uniref:Solute carrier family 12 member 9 n=1 Tax=Lepisosteus oculatus TaxID=7918 RepID=W5N7I6_LEPOC